MASTNPGNPQAVDAAFAAAQGIVTGVAQSHRKLIATLHSVVSYVDSAWFLQAFRDQVDQYGKQADDGIAAAIASGKAIADALTSFSTDVSHMRRSTIPTQPTSQFYPAFLDPTLAASDKLALANKYEAKCQAIRATGNMVRHEGCALSRYSC
jgi:hypothetical protein